MRWIWLGNCSDAPITINNVSSSTIVKDLAQCENEARKGGRGRCELWSSELVISGQGEAIYGGRLKDETHGAALVGEELDDLVVA